MKQNFLFTCTLFVLVFTSAKLLAQVPDPPDGKIWVKIDNMSDEFDGTELNTDKWAKNVSTWEGREPARFETWAVTVGDGKLRITGSKKDNPYDGWTHNGGLVRSTNKATYGYFETRMKANKTFLSSTFWLINTRNEGSGCDERTTELDVTETIGINTGGDNWITDAISKMRSNTHSRSTSCTSTPEGQVGNTTGLGNKSYEGYHVYGVWWKSETEIRFYLDGVYKYTITPPADFNLGMYLRMVVESYDWNPPLDGSDGMEDIWANRTTYYDWTRSWTLEDDDSTVKSAKIITNNIKDAAVQVYPNPAQDQLTLTGIPDGVCNVTIYNIQGKILKNLPVDISNSQAEIQISELTKGVYILKVNNEEINTTMRFIKE